MNLKTSAYSLAILTLCGFQIANAQSAPPMRFIPASSANYSARSSRTIDRIVIHTIEGSEAGAISWFQNSRSRVSAHYIVSHAGRVTRMLRDSDIGYHCRTWNGRAIGIENEGWASRNTWTSAQMARLADLTAYLCKRYNIPADRTHLVGHVEVPGNTHTDPGPHFNWSSFISMVRSRLGGGSTTPAPSPTPTPSPSASTYEVTASSLNVRSSAWGTKLGAISRGTKFVATGARDGDWREIFYAGRKAWIHSGYVRAASATVQQVTTASLNVRTGASTGYQRIGSVANGQRYTQDTSSGSWRRIQFDGRKGWAHGNYLSQVR